MNNDHLSCATSDQVYHAPPAGFPCVKRLSDNPATVFFIWGLLKKVRRQAKKCYGRKRTHFTFFTFCTRCLWSLGFFTSFVHRIDVWNLSIETCQQRPLFVCIIGWLLCTGFTVRRIILPWPKKKIETTSPHVTQACDLSSMHAPMFGLRACLNFFLARVVVGTINSYNPLRANYCHTWHMENHPFLWRRIRRVRRIQVCMARRGLI